MPTAVVDRDAKLDAVQDAPARPQTRNYFGQMVLDWDDYVLRRNEKRRLWNEQTDAEDEKRLIITFTLHPLPGAPSAKPIKKEVIGQSREFDKYLRPSLAKTGVRLSNLKNAYCQIALVPDGGTYTRTNQETGATEVGESTALTIVAVYPNEAAAQAAADVLFKRNGSPSPETTVAPARPAAPTILSGEALESALTGFWQMSGQNEQAFLASISAMPPFQGLTLDSPVVKKIIGTF